MASPHVFPFSLSERFGRLHSRFSYDYADYYSGYNYYPSYDDDYGLDHEYEDDYDDNYDMVYRENEGYGRNSEDEEGEYSDEEEAHSDDDRRSPSLDEREPTVKQEPIVKQEDDKTIACVADGTHPSTVEEVKVNVKQEIGEGIHDGPIVWHPGLKLENEGSSASSAPGAIYQLVASGGGNEKSTHSSKIGPDVETEAKRVSDRRSLIRPDLLSHT